MPPDPATGWSREIVTIKNAIIVAPQFRSMSQATGILDENGEHVGHGAAYRFGQALTYAPPMPEGPIPRLPGRHFWGGQLWPHFGHFLCEGMTRLWALPMVGDIDSILHVPRMLLGVEQAVVPLVPRPFQREMFSLLGITTPMNYVAQAVQVDQLVVPGQGFGIGAISAGTPEYHALMHEHLARDIPAAGAEKIYISRSALRLPLRGIFGEPALEANLERQGYAIYRPEKHSISAQIAQYRAAKVVLGLDGSPFHLLGFVARPDQQIGVIERRISDNQEPMYAQLEGFSTRKPDAISVLHGQYMAHARMTPGHFHYGHLDFMRLAKVLIDLGYIDSLDSWEIPPWRRYRREIAQIENRTGLTLVNVPPDVSPAVFRRRMAEQFPEAPQSAAASDDAADID